MNLLAMDNEIYTLFSNRYADSMNHYTIVINFLSTKLCEDHLVLSQWSRNIEINTGITKIYLQDNIISIFLDNAIKHGNSYSRKSY
jgi:hypothetical protein